MRISRSKGVHGWSCFLRARTVTAVLISLAAGAASVQAQVQSEAPKLEIEPSDPAPGALVRLTLTAGALADSVTGVTGSMAGEPLHFVMAGEGIWRAVGPV